MAPNLRDTRVGDLALKISVTLNDEKEALSEEVVSFAGEIDQCG